MQKNKNLDPVNDPLHAHSGLVLVQMVNPEKDAGLALVQMAQAEKTCPVLTWKALMEAVESPVG